MNRATKYHLVYRRAAILLVWISISFYFAAAQVPQKPNPPKLVNDFAGILTPQQVSELESKLVKFSQETSNQVVIVTVQSLGGMDKAQLAFSIGQQWGVGESDFNNGIVILVKSKTGNEYGEAFIATGYGLESALPDAICKRIVENEMIPAFRINDYCGGLQASLDIILPIAAGEYNYREYAKENYIGGVISLLFFILCIIIFMRAVYKGGSNIGGQKRGISQLDMFLIGAMSGRMSGGGYRSGNFGGGSRGFGGFGGGGFGGGGAGGSW